MADNPIFVASVVTVAAFNLIPLARKLKLVLLDNLIVSPPYRFNVEPVPSALKLIVFVPAFKVVAESPMIGESALKSVVAVARIS